MQKNKGFRHVLNIGIDNGGFIVVDMAMIDSMKYDGGAIFLTHRYNGTTTVNGLTVESAQQIRAMFSQSRGAEHGQGIYEQLSTEGDEGSIDEGEVSDSEKTSS